MPKPSSKEIAVMEKYLTKAFPNKTIKKEADGPLVIFKIIGEHKVGDVVAQLRDDYGDEFLFWYADFKEGLHINFSKI